MTDTDHSPLFQSADEGEIETNIFASVDWDEGSDNPFGLDPGTYEVTISETEVTRSEKGNLGLWVQFSTDAEREDAGVSKSIKKWVSLPEKTQDVQTRKRNTSFLRLLMRNLEIPEERWEKLDPADLIGLDCVITVVPQKNDPQYMQVRKISRGRGTSIPTGVSGMAEFGKPQDLDVPVDGGYKF